MEARPTYKSQKVNIRCSFDIKPYFKRFAAFVYFKKSSAVSVMHMGQRVDFKPPKAILEG